MSFSSDKPSLANQLPISIDFPKNPDQLLETLQNSYKRTANAINTKEGSLYLLEELANFQQYFLYSDSATFTPDPNRIRNGYRTTFDLVGLNGGPIPPGLTNLVLSAVTQPPLINGILIPTHGFGAGTIPGPIYVFNGTDFNVRFDNTIPGAQVINITNNTGANLTQLYWTIEYLKN